MAQAQDTFVPSRGRPSLLTRARRRGFRALPLLVWCAAIAAIFLLAHGQRAPLPYPAITQVTRYTVTAPIDARLVTLTVQEHQPVEAGQLVGSLDSQDLRLRLDRVRAEISRLQAEAQKEAALVQVTEHERLTDREMDLRRLRRDRENAQIDVLEQQVVIEEDGIRLVALADTLRRTADLAKRDVDSEALLIDVRANHDAVVERIRRTEILLRERQAKAAASEKRLADYLGINPKDRTQVVDAAAPLSWAVKAQQVELEEVALLRTRLSLRAPGSGRVENILVRPNELLVAGQPLLTIVDTKPRGLVAYLPERDVEGVRPGMRAEVQSLSNPRVTTETRVTSLGLTVEQVPQQLWLDPRRPQWGRPVYLALPATWQELPGAAMRVRLFPE